MKINDEYAELAIEAARIGGNLLKEQFGKTDSISIVEKRTGDWVSEADKLSESAIIDFLLKNTSGHDILAEEKGVIKSGVTSHYRWIIDPLDGTTNFIRGFPVWAVSIALEHRPDPGSKWGEIVAGAIDIPPTGETFSASKDGGAFLNGKRIAIKKSRSFRESLLATGFPFRTRQLAGKYIELLEDILLRCGDVRRAGAVAVDLCYVAAGIFDGFWELDLSPWDIAAGGLIIEEAGGKTSNFQGGSDYLATGDIVAGNPVIFDELIATVREHFPEARDIDKSSGI